MFAVFLVFGEVCVFTVFLVSVHCVLVNSVCLLCSLCFVSCVFGVLCMLICCVPCVW